jgi:hypothetical protein
VTAAAAAARSACLRWLCTREQLKVLF